MVDAQYRLNPEPPSGIIPAGCTFSPDEVGAMLANRVVQPHYAAWLVRQAIEAAHAREIESLRQRAEAAEAMSSEPGLLRLLVDLRFALGDNGKRMQDELVEYARELAADARRLDWLSEALGYVAIGSVDPAAHLTEDSTIGEEWRAAIDAAMSWADGEIVPSGCGVEARIHFEDPRYPTLVLDGDEFGTIGYELRRDTGELRRVCICHAHCEHECVCGYDAAIASGGEG